VNDRLRFKTYVLTVIVVFANLFGNLLMSWGIKQRGAILGGEALEYIRVIFDPVVGAGVALLMLWLLTRMTLLSWADLSYVLPVTAIGYVLSAVAGRVALGEHVTPARWAGCLLIAAGVALVGSTSIRTTQPAEAREETFVR
jgi:uncharacterized membrane protein